MSHLSLCRALPVELPLVVVSTHLGAASQVPRGTAGPPPPLVDGAWETARAGAGGNSGDSVLWRDPVCLSPLILEELVLVIHTQLREMRTHLLSGDVLSVKWSFYGWSFLRDAA